MNQPIIDNKEEKKEIYETVTGSKEFFNKYLGSIVGVAGVLAGFFASTLVQPAGGITLKEKMMNPWFWVIWGVIFAIVVMVSNTNYNTSKRDTKEKPKFKGTMKYYSEQKTKAMENIELLPLFCQEKNEEIFAIIEQEIVESADLMYSKYKDGQYDKSKLEQWQLDKLAKIKDINIEKMRPTDLTQETGHNYKVKKYSFLPPSEQEASKGRFRKQILNKILNTLVFSIVGSMTISIMGWVSGLTNIFGILVAWGTSILSGIDFVENTLRSRFIAKADFLLEFNNSIPRLKLKKAKLDEERKKAINEEVNKNSIQDTAKQEKPVLEAKNEVLVVSQQKLA